MIQYFLPQNASQVTKVNSSVLLAFLLFSFSITLVGSFIDFGDDTPFELIAILNLILIILFYRFKSIILVGNLYLSLWGFSLFAMSLDTGGIYSMDSLCLVLAPIVAYTLLGKHSGHVWFLITFIVAIYLWYLAADPKKNLQFLEARTAFDRNYYLAAHIILLLWSGGLFFLFSYHYRQLVNTLNTKKEELNQSLTLLQKQSKLLERSRDELQRSNRELEEYANATSHDLKQPIRNVNNFANLLHKHLSKQDKLDTRTEQMLGFITEGSDRMLNLISDLLSFAKLKTEIDKVFEEVDLNTIVKDVLFNLNSTVEKTGTTIHIQPLPTATVIPVKLGQVFQNLMSNAIKFRKKEEPLRLHISAKETEEFVTISIQDNGIGIEEEFLEKIFIPFKKLHAQHKYKGSGIGLATVKHIVELHQGKIWVESVFGKGSTFHFTLSKLLNTNQQEHRMVLPASELN